MNEQKTEHSNQAHTQKAYDVSSPSNLLRHRFVPFLQCMFLGCQNVDASTLHNIDDISQS